ncbi:PREDICTED: uncharacterized protein LOC105152445 isoform X3 [Acromyrmex echinatior]|uniref:uncharacterized protein LOC105152445 isoform X3 n=1 Tax=Acromyrmex echinatior TaxID=103372 RepID=UPI0005810D3F|nr:PREDICTED: uncharacterized protein LOC105152445 isoform X3 [Acromyrmex echinatior]
MGMATLSRLVKFGLHVYGIWPYASFTVVFRSYWIIMLSIAQVFQYRYVIMNIHMDDFSQYMDGVSSAMASTLLYTKLVILWTHQRIFFDVLQMMSTDWQDYTSNSYISHIMTDTANVAHRTSRWIVVTRHTECRSDFGEICIILHLDKPRGIHILLLWRISQRQEQNDWKCDVQFSLVRFSSQRRSNYTVSYSEITKKIDNHKRKSRRPFFGAIYQLKASLSYISVLLAMY